MPETSQPRSPAGPMRCPRCPAQLPRGAMVRHLWVQHRLLLDGQRAREPWEVADDLLAFYAAHKAPGVLARCFELATHANAIHGAERVRQRLRALKLRPNEEDALRAAAEDGASLCPRCRMLVPVRREPALRPLAAAHGRLGGDGYVIEVSESGWAPWLEVQTPTAVVQRGPEEGRGWTPRTLLLILAGPPVVLAVGVAIVANLLGQSGVAAVTTLLWLALMAYLFIRVRELFQGKPLDRAVDYAWTLLVPKLHADGFNKDEADFLARLALASAGRGRMPVRADAVAHLLTVTEKALRAGPATPGHLAALVRLAAEDAAALGGDFVTPVAREVGRCFSGELPLAFAERLLEGWESACWTAGNLARLRALVADRAFALGLTAADLADVGRAAPAFGEVLQTEDAAGLARLALLRGQRESRPWARVGAAVTVFELAEQSEPGLRALDRRPDLLLLPEPAIEICTGGVRLAGKLLTQLPSTISVEERGDGFEVTAGPVRARFPEDPAELVWRLERWCRWWFDEFVPQAAAVTGRSTAAARLWERTAVLCPECRQRFVPWPGAAGMAVE